MGPYTHGEDEAEKNETETLRHRLDLNATKKRRATQPLWPFGIFRTASCPSQREGRSAAFSGFTWALCSVRGKCGRLERLPTTRTRRQDLRIATGAVIAQTPLAMTAREMNERSRLTRRPSERGQEEVRGQNGGQTLSIGAVVTVLERRTVRHVPSGLPLRPRRACLLEYEGKRRRKWARMSDFSNAPEKSSKAPCRPQ